MKKIHFSFSMIYQWIYSVYWTFKKIYACFPPSSVVTQVVFYVFGINNVRRCSYYIGTVPLQFQRLQINSICVCSLGECQGFECNAIYVYSFVTQFPTVSTIVINDAGKCMLTCVSA